MKILIAEDEINLLNMLGFLFRSKGFDVELFSNGVDALKYFEENSETVSVALLDVMMPGMNGYELCDKIKSIRNIPIMILTAKNQPKDQLDSFKVGADDYLSKPFNNEVVLTRIKKLIELYNIEEVIEYNGIVLNSKNYEAFYNNEPVHLSNKEFDLLKKLIINKGNVVKKDEAIIEIWGEDSLNSRTIDTHVKNLRKKFSDVPDFISTIHGIGYKIG